MATNVYLCDISLPDGESPDIARLCAGLSESRREKIQARRMEKDKLQVLGAGLLLNFGLGRYGLSEREAVISFGTSGKPYLRDYPEIHFNLSHSGTMVMAVFSDREAGCDVERIQPARMNLARRFFTGEEYKVLEAEKNPENRDRLFFRLWTMKESYIKAVGEGMKLPLNSFSVLPGKTPGTHIFHEYPQTEYQAAICLKHTPRGTPGNIFFSFQKLTDVV